jgi:tRNA-Thr(GGU) m(6)t(6)A37 methyltransferase TsaA
MALTAIGHLRTPWRTVAACPRNGRQLDPAPACTAVVRPEWRAALAGLDGFTHLILLYWLGDAARRPLALIRPPFDPRPRGVFATRSPRRPNPVGFSVVRFDGFAAPGRLRVRYLDCRDGTPLLDIKPYLPTTDSEPDAAMGWLAPHATRKLSR